MQAMRWDVKGASSLVQFGLIEGSVKDPGYYALQVVTKHMRAFATVDRTYHILDAIVSHPQKTHVPGPAGVFIQWLHTIGWQWQGNGFIFASILVTHPSSGCLSALNMHGEGS